jgi:hypothetical protein
VSRRAAAVAVLLMAGACASPPAKRVATPPPVQGQSAAPAPAAAAAPSADSCGATELQSLVGRLRTEIPAPVYPDRERVACTTCPITQDYRPERLNIFFDAETGRIRQIRCG